RPERSDRAHRRGLRPRSRRRSRGGGPEADGRDRDAPRAAGQGHQAVRARAKRRAEAQVLPPALLELSSLAHMAGFNRVVGPAAGWLASRRGELNQRFERVRRRFPSISAEAVLGALAEILPPLAGPEPASGDLLSATYDLVLLHVARDSFAARPGVDAL